MEEMLYTKKELQWLREKQSNERVFHDFTKGSSVSQVQSFKKNVWGEERRPVS